MKITRIEDYRLNFELNGFHYSLQEDYDEGYCSLQCKETKQSWGTEAFNNARYRDIISHFTTGKDGKTGSTFNQKI